MVKTFQENNASPFVIVQHSDAEGVWDEQAIEQALEFALQFQRENLRRWERETEPVAVG